MNLIVEERVQQALRHLQRADGAKVIQAFDRLQAMDLEGLRHSNKTAKLAGPRPDMFVYKATPRLRILFRYQHRNEPSLIIEDIVSHDLLERHFSSRKAQ